MQYISKQLYQLMKENNIYNSFFKVAIYCQESERQLAQLVMEYFTNQKVKYDQKSLSSDIQFSNYNNSYEFCYIVTIIEDKDIVTELQFSGADLVVFLCPEQPDEMRDTFHKLMQMIELFQKSNQVQDSSGIASNQLPDLEQAELSQEQDDRPFGCHLLILNSYDQTSFSSSISEFD